MAVFKKERQWYIDYYVKGVRTRERIGPDTRLATTAPRQCCV
jgi:hypothetical protein